MTKQKHGAIFRPYGNMANDTLHVGRRDRIEMSAHVETTNALKVSSTVKVSVAAKCSDLFPTNG